MDAAKSCVPSIRIPKESRLVSIGMMSTIRDTALRKLSGVGGLHFL